MLLVTRRNFVYSRFVDFNGTRELVIETAGTLFTVDFGNLAKRMVDEQIVENI